MKLNKYVGVRMSEEEYSRLKIMASLNNVTISKMVRMMINKEV